jgi:hypothetical protein
MVSYCVVVLEPAHPQEPCGLEDQVHEVVGPFGDPDQADAWITERQARHAVSAEFALAPSHFTFMITELRPPTPL